MIKSWEELLTSVGLQAIATSPLLLSVLKEYSGLQPDQVHLRLCSGILKDAATQTKRFRCTSLTCNPLYVSGRSSGRGASGEK